MELGDALSELRIAKGLMQEELASILGVSSQTISSWEVGRRFPHKRNLKRLAELYGVSLAELESYGRGPSSPPKAMPILRQDKDGTYRGIERLYQPPIDTGADFMMRHTGPSFLDKDIKSGDLVMFTIVKELTDWDVYIVEVGDHLRLMRLVRLPNGTILLTEGEGTSSSTSLIVEDESTLLTDPGSDTSSPFILGKVTHVLRRI